MKLSLKLTHKIMLMLFAVLVVSICGVAIVSIRQASEYLTDSAKSDLSHLAAMAKEVCEINAAERLNLVQSNLNTSRKLLDDLSRKQVIVRDGRMILDPNGQAYVINDDTGFVDRVEDLTGACCAVFLKEGNRAMRISTSIVNENGERAVGTYLPDSVYNEVIRNGRKFSGRSWVINAWYISAYEPIRDIGDEVVGVLFCSVCEHSDDLGKVILAQKVGETGYIYAIDSKGTLQIHPAKEGTNISDNDFVREIMIDGPKLNDGEIGWIRYSWINRELGETEAKEKIVAYTYFADWDWIIAVGSYLEEFTGPVNNIKHAVVWLGLLFLAVSFVIGFFIARNITRPIIGLVNVAEAVAIGDVSKQIEIRSNDEVGILARSFDSVIDYLQEAAGVAERMANNDLTATIEPKSDKDVFGKSLKLMTENLSSMIRQLASDSHELANAVNEITASAEQMSRGASDQSQQIDQVSSAIEEMAANIVESSRNTAEATDASRNAFQQAADGGQIVSETIYGMQKITQTVRGSADSITRLAESVDQIGKIIGVIDEIADQTNLLALNAAIEAARAGEQGRGFAVVADEVRKLAERTGRATGEITEMIKGVQRQTGEAVHSMESGLQEVEKGRELTDRAGSSLSEIVSMSEHLGLMIQQIAQATEEQSAASEQISKNVEQIAMVTRETAKGAEQSATAAEELNRQADSLNKMVARFRLR